MFGVSNLIIQVPKPILLFACTIFTLAGVDAQDLGFDTTYYYDLYGSQIADTIPKELSFSVGWNGRISPRIKGQYKARTYKQDKLTTIVYFVRPSLKAVAVEYKLPHAWTEEQIKAALLPYGKNWQSVRGAHENASTLMVPGFQTLLSEKGVFAHYSPIMRRVVILSPHILKEFDKVIESYKKEIQKVPKF